MNKLVRTMQFASLSLLLLLTACFRDGLEECPPASEYYSYIRFVYDRNLAYTDLFHRQVNRMDVYLFDGDGVFMQRLTDSAPEGSTFPEGYVMGLPEECKDVVQFVAIGGFNEEQLRPNAMTRGHSTIDDLNIALIDRGNNTVNYALTPLWHGSIAYTQTRAAIERNDTTTISLTKNTNDIRIVIQSLDSDVTVQAHDFNFTLRSANGEYDAFNRPIGQTYWNYIPYFSYNDNETGVVAETHTMRLLSDRQNRFTLYQTTDDSTNTLLDIDLNNYINALKLQKYSSMSLQEYMDREDEYSIIVFVQKGKDPVTGVENLVATRISINSWIVRDEGLEVNN